MTNGHVTTVPSPGYQPYCPDCGGIPPAMWSWGYFREPPRFDGVAFAPPRTLQRSTRQHEVVDLQAIQRFWHDFVQWRQAWGVLETVKGIQGTYYVQDVIEQLGRQLDGSALWASLVMADPQTPYMLDVDDGEEARALQSAIRGLHNYGPSTLAVTPREAGVCQQHFCLVDRHAIALEVEVGRSGVLTVRADGVVVFGADSGQWACFLQTTEKSVDASENDDATAPNP